MERFWHASTLYDLVYADKRYQRHDKRDKLPAWITTHFKDSHLNLSTDMLLCIAREFMRGMAQPYDRNAVGKSLLSEAQVNALDTANATMQMEVGSWQGKLYVELDRTVCLLY